MKIKFVFWFLGTRQNEAEKCEILMKKLRKPPKMSIK